MAGRRCVVMGLGLFSGGVAAVRFLVARGARVVVTDLRDEEALAPSVEALADLEPAWRLGGHREEDFDEADLVVVNPGVRPDDPLLARAVAGGAVLETETNLFLRSCPATVIAVTGSNGKSTTASLLASMLEAEGRTVHLGGNIGRSLLNAAATMAPGDDVVLEISSFQLEWTERAGLRPDHAVLTNVHPNHLDRHGTFERYLELKAAVAPGEEGVLVLCADDDGAREVARRVTGRVVEAGLGDGRDAAGPGCRWEGSVLVWRSPEGGRETLLEAADVRLRGGFNRANVACAAAMARALGAGAAAVAAGCRAFRGLPHRLEECGEVDGVRCVNDSKATTPEAAALALEAYDAPLVVIAGGSDKGADLEAYSRALAARARAVVLLGATAPLLRAALGNCAGDGPDVRDAGSMEEAVRTGLSLAARGDVLLLSPAHASFGMFRNFEERGDRFREAVVNAAVSSREP